MRTRSRLLAAAAALSAALIGQGPAQAAGPQYVALGDSYSSGTGTRQYLADGTGCQRSARAYPSLLAASRGYSLSLRACAGARVGDVAANQLDALSPSTSVVTISVGGNDVGFVPVLTECAKPSWMSDCFGRLATARGAISGVLPGQLDGLFAQIRARAPQAQVTVVGYPRLFNGRNCDALTWFSSAEMTQLNETADQLNGVIAQRAAAAGFTFADPTGAFTGHAVCGSPAWINGLSYPVAESYHPNQGGHASGYLPVVSGSVAGMRTGSMRDGSTPDGATLERAARAQEATLTADARRYSARDRSIVAEQFRRVDLNSPEARADAARAGVDVRDRASVDLADRAYGRAQAEAYGLSDR